MAEEPIDVIEQTELVRATQLGHYLRLREPGEEFEIPKRLFSEVWMEYVVPAIDNVPKEPVASMNIENQDTTDPEFEVVKKKKAKKEE